MWKIHSWSTEARTGTVQGKHVGPLPFDVRHTEVLDYAVGEVVVVEVDQGSTGIEVRRVAPQRARAPQGTSLPELRAVNELELWDYRVHTYANDVLTIFGSHDFTYSHSVEIDFCDVSFLSLPTTFSCPRFRKATHEERASLGEHGASGQVFCIVEDHAEDDAGSRHFVVAQSVQHRLGTVFYYRRENLQEGERIAPWVK